MDFNNIFSEWKNKGTEPTKDLQDNGFKAGYKPPANIFNWFWSKVISAVGELQTAFKNHTESEVLDHPDGSVTNKKIRDDAITGAKIKNNTITGGHEITEDNGSVSTDGHIAVRTITGDNIDYSTIKGDNIGNKEIKTANIDDKGVTTAKIADKAVGTAQIADKAITGQQIETKTITNVHMNDGAIQTYAIEDGAVTARKIADGDVTGDKIADNTITGDNLADYSLDNIRVRKEVTYLGVNGVKPNGLPTNPSIKDIVKTIDTYFNHLKLLAFTGSYNDLTDKPTSMTPTSHASTSTNYGIGTASNYGHVKTSDSVTSTSDTSSGIAATPKAVKTAYDKAVAVGNKKIWYSSGVTIAGTDSTAFSSQNVNIKGNRSVAIAYGNSYDIVTEIDGDTSLLAACAASKIKGSTSAIIGGYAHNLDGLRALILGGYNNIAHGYNVVVGKSNKEPTATDYNSSSGDLFVVGNGTGSTRSNAFRVAANGNCYAGVAFNGTGADYNEVREWSDGNTDAEDRCGYMVAFEGTKIRLAQPGDNLRKVGIISGNSCITGNNFADYWHGKYKRDIYGRYETSPVHNDAEYDEDGNIIKEAYDGYAYVLSEDYDSALEDSYEPRLDRSEYDLMATHGEVVVRDDGTCEVDGYCIPSQDGIATKDNDEIGFYVMERVDGNHVRVFVR